MSQNHDTPNPSPLSLADAMAKAENAASDLHNIADLLAALASSHAVIQPGGLFPIADAAELAADATDEAWKVLFPALNAPARTQFPASAAPPPDNPAFTHLDDMETSLHQMACCAALLRGLIGSPHEIKGDTLVPIANELGRLHRGLHSAWTTAFQAAGGTP